MQRIRRLRGPGKTGLVRMALLAVLAVGALSLPATSGAIVYIEGQESDQLPEYDITAGDDLQPLAFQTSAAKELDAKVTWNVHGTPATIFNRSGFVATGVKGASAAAAARSWINANRKLFGIPSTRSLKLVTAAPLRGTSTDHAVVFRQSFHNVISDGQLAVSIVGTAKTGWKIT